MSGGQNDNLEMGERNSSSSVAQPSDMNEIMNSSEEKEDSPRMCTEDTDENVPEKTRPNNGSESAPNSKEDVNMEERAPLIPSQATDQNATPKSSRRTSDADEIAGESSGRYPKQEENTVRNGGTRPIISDENSPSAVLEITDRDGIPEHNEADDNRSNKSVKKGWCKAWCKDHPYILASVIVISVILALANFVQIQVYHHLQSETLLQIPPHPQFQHAVLYLKTEGYTHPDKEIRLQWKKDEKQSVGNIQLKNSQQKSVTPAPPQFHHSFFDLITEGYKHIDI
ncbi:Hypothetical predicted protein [Octopus vulgaris]|uniref:Uncharacterized protein n=1 Tax=Octopus vulgaris TaxID=6645 RepID=A0AA36BUU5_OCTVU|nr:Hypothetical predicted protein [Octopus vulgaris]